MAKTRRDILRERRDKELREKKKVKKVDPNTKKTSIGFIKGGLIGAGVGFAVGHFTNQRAFYTILGFLGGGYLAENLKRMEERQQATDQKFVNFNKRPSRWN